MTTTSIHLICTTCIHKDVWGSSAAQDSCDVCCVNRGSGSGFGSKFESVNNKPTHEKGEYYKYTYKSIKFDVYRAAQILGITHGADHHGIKKWVRAGKGSKSLKQDMLEVRDIINRRIEMIEEDESDVE